MQVYCVSFTSAEQTPNDALCEELKKSPDWWRCFGSTWLVLTAETASQLFDRLKPHFGSDDRVLVIGVTRDYSGWLPPDAWSWATQNLSREDVS